MPTSESTERQPVFEYRTLRLLVGGISFALPWVVLIFSSFIPLSSISASYHTGARDIFVGSLFMIGTLLVAYQGHEPIENWIANLGAVAAIVAALFPTSCDLCKTSPISVLHLLAGATLFSVIAYFCLGPFRQSAKKKTGDKAKGQGLYSLRICDYRMYPGCRDRSIPSSRRIKKSIAAHILGGGDCAGGVRLCLDSGEQIFNLVC